MCEPEREGQRRCTPWVRKAGKLVKTDKEKTELLNYFFPLSIFTVNLYFKNTLQGKSPLTRKRKMLHPFLKRAKKEDPGNYCFFSLPSMPEKTVEQILLETVLKYMEDKEVTQDSFTGHFYQGQILPDQSSGHL